MSPQRKFNCSSYLSPKFAPPPSLHEMGGVCCGKMPDAVDFLAQFPPEPEKCLGKPSDEVFTFNMKQKLISLNGQDHSIKTKDGQVLATMQKKALSLRDRYVLKDHAGEPVACILEKVMSIGPVFFVYSFKPYFEGQLPTSEKQGGKPLYAWAKVWRKSSWVNEYHICMAIENNKYAPDKDASYKALSPGMMSEQLMVYKGCQADAQAQLGCCLVKKAAMSPTYDVTVAANIDLILMIALIGIKDKVDK